MAFFAHSLGNDSDESRWQSLAEHLVSVARIAQRFASEAKPGDDEFAQAARSAGLLHDFGKYRPEFQAMLRGAPKTEATRHKNAGAARASDLKRLDLAFVIAGHHGGLPDRSALKDSIRSPAGLGVVRQHWDSAVKDCPEIDHEIAALHQCDTVQSLDVFIRLLFSCLVDADWQDTSDFYRRAAGRSESASPVAFAPATALANLMTYIEARAGACKDRRVADIRRETLDFALAAAAEPPGLFTMTVPTGGGKTLSSLAFALSHASQHGLRRVIYVAPYLSILEQNAREIRRALGVENGDFVFEHHSLADPLDKAEESQADAADANQRAEAWDSPVVVTTNVQFFESLFANQPGRCRKLHNAARSVIVLDECQTLPPGLARPTCSMLGEFALQTGSTIVMCTATQPAWNRRESFEEGFSNAREIAPPELRLFERLLRVNIIWPADRDVTLDWTDVAEKMSDHRAVLCIVNSKGAARQIHRLLRERGCDDALHLSTNMCPRHRLETIDEVRRRLQARVPCRLVSTQLIEAGVDVDFPAVMREMAPLEAIIQAAGRANREGLLNHPDGTPGGQVIVFRSAQPAKLDRWYQAGTGIVEADFLRAGRKPDIAQPEHVAEYFRRLYASGNTDRKKIESLREAQSFQQVAENYRLIEDATYSVVVATWEKARYEVEDALDKLRAGWDRRLARRLAPYQVNVRHSQGEQFSTLIADGPAGIKVWWGPYDERIGMSSELQSDWWVV